MASTMDQFERQFENLDVQSEFVENAMGNQATLSTPEEDVNLLLQQACSCRWFIPRVHGAIVGALVERDVMRVRDELTTAVGQCQRGGWDPIVV